MTKKIYFSTLLAALLLVSGCIKNVEERGYATNFKELSNLEGSITNKVEVEEILGSPSTVSTFGNETWYYIRSRSERVAFMKAEPVEQEVLAVVFDNESNIKDIEHYTLQDGKRIEFSSDTTHTEGNELNIGEQLLGNLGRFNPTQ